MSPLIVSVSGIRGVVGESLTPQVVMDFSAAYGAGLAGRQVVLSRDGRASGPMLHHAAMAGLLAAGCNVLDIGIAATPTCGFYVKHKSAAGAVQITASHNPPQWNGLKLFRPEGFVLSPAAGQAIADRYQSREWSLASWDKLGAAEIVSDPHSPHLERVLSLVDVAAIRNRKFKVLLDANHGSGGTFGPRLLERLGCDFSIIGATPDGAFAHPPEPTEENLRGVCKIVRDHGADVGFAVDPDADRLALIDETGTYAGEEYTLALAILHRTRQAQGPVVLNGSTSRVSEDVARNAGCAVERTKVGEVHVAERMLATGAVIGGEGNGGVIDPRVGLGRDSAVAMALVLDLLAASKKCLSEILRNMPVYVIQKEKFPVRPERLPETFRRLRVRFSDGKIDEADGVRVDWPDAWVQVRASNTEPIVRVIAEAQDPARAHGLCAAVGELL